MIKIMYIDAQYKSGSPESDYAKARIGWLEDKDYGVKPYSKLQENAGDVEDRRELLEIGEEFDHAIVVLGERGTEFDLREEIFNSRFFNKGNITLVGTSGRSSFGAEKLTDAELAERRNLGFKEVYELSQGPDPLNVKPQNYSTAMTLAVEAGRS